MLLDFKDTPAKDCAKVNALLDEHIVHVGTRVRELRKLEKELRALRDQCRLAQAAANCGILNGLSKAAQSSAPGPASHVGRVHGAPVKHRSGTVKQSAPRR